MSMSKRTPTYPCFAYPRHPKKTLKWKEFRLINKWLKVWGYVPGVCWKIFRNRKCIYQYPHWWLGLFHCQWYQKKWCVCFPFLKEEYSRLWSMLENSLIMEKKSTPDMLDTPPWLFLLVHHEVAGCNLDEIGGWRGGCSMFFISVFCSAVVLEVSIK